MQSVSRALSLLTAIGSRSRGATLSELADEVGVPTSTAHRMLAALVEHGYARRVPTTRRYVVGPRIAEIWEVSQSTSSVAVPEQVQHASDVSGETVFLCEFAGGEAVCVALAQSRFPLRLFVQVGQRMPLHAAASARVLLAWRDEREVRRLLSSTDLRRYTESTPADVDSVLDRLADVRERGFDVCDSELDLRVRAISYPVRSSTGLVVASLTLATPTHRAGDAAERARAQALVAQAARSLSERVGG